MLNLLLNSERVSWILIPSAFNFVLLNRTDSKFQISCLYLLSALYFCGFASEHQISVISLFFFTCFFLDRRPSFWFYHKFLFRYLNCSVSLGCFNFAQIFVNFSYLMFQIESNAWKQKKFPVTIIGDMIKVPYSFFWECTRDVRFGCWKEIGCAFCSQISK